MNSNLGRILLSALFVLVCWGVADAQRSKGSKGPKAKVTEVNTGWASLEVEVRDVATDKLISGSVSPVELSKTYAAADEHTVVLEVQAEGYVGSREHLFVVDPQEETTYPFTVYLQKPVVPAAVQHMAQID